MLGRRCACVSALHWCASTASTYGLRWVLCGLILCVHILVEATARWHTSTGTRLQWDLAEACCIQCLFTTLISGCPVEAAQANTIV